MSDTCNNCARLRAALQELVDLKDIRDSLDHKQHADYTRRKPLAWKAAREALAATEPDSSAILEYSHPWNAQMRGI